MKLALKLTFYVLIVSCLIFPEAGFGQKKPKPKCGASSWKTCPVQGCGGDPNLNRKKNKTTKPAASSVEERTLARIIAMDAPDKWKAGSPRGPLEDIGEGDVAEVTAYLIHAKNYPSGVESCNCNLKKTENNDFHLVLVDSRSKQEQDSVTAEISPRIRPAGWTIEKLRKLAKEKAYVKLVGYMMLDTQHLSKPIKRKTNWEIHPVTKFEVCTASESACDQGNGWKALAQVP